MKRLIRFVPTLLLILATTAAAAPVQRVRGIAPPSSAPTTRTFIWTNTESEQSVLQLRRELIASGARNVNYFVPSVVVCEMPASVNLPQMVEGRSFRFMAESDAGMQTVSAATPEIREAQRAYDIAAALNHPALPGAGEVVSHEKVIRVSEDDIREWRRRRPMELVEGETPPKDPDQNAEFMVGDILAQFVLPESTGPREDWTDAELGGAVSGSQAACLAFQQSFPWVPMHFVFNTKRRVSTIYEPITNNMSTDETWILDTMSSLGINDARASLAVHTFNNQGLGRFGTDWAFTCFIADSRNEPGNIFQGSLGGAGYTAYANLGGPYLIIPYPAGSNDPNNLGEVLLFSKIMQHEQVHIFWGFDEYLASTLTDCNSRVGYFAWPNRNDLSVVGGQVIGCPTYVPCIMWGAREDDDGTRPICSHTAAQMGLKDANNNSIVDVYDSPPDVIFENTAVETIRASLHTLRFTVRSTAVPNSNPLINVNRRIDYAAPLKDATLSVDGIGAIFVKPVDGRWDSGEEEVEFTLDGIKAGLTTVEVKARNVAGRASGLRAKRLYFIGVNFAFFDFEQMNNALRIKWQTVGDTFGASHEVYRRKAGDSNSEMVASGNSIVEITLPGSSFHNYWYTDRDVLPGAKYEYFVRASSAEQGFEIDSPTQAITAALPINTGNLVSAVSPNPFNSRTSVSIDIPPTYADNRDDLGGATGIQRQVQTRVEVTIYDVAGRPVKSVFEGKIFSRIETFFWDGTNSRNQPVPSGIYFVRATAGLLTEVRKVVVVR